MKFCFYILGINRSLFTFERDQENNNYLVSKIWSLALARRLQFIVSLIHFKLS